MLHIKINIVTGLELCFIFAVNTQADPSINLLAIGAVVIGLLTLTNFTGLIYKRTYLDILEISFILNLGILAVAIYYVKLAVVPVSQAAVTFISVGIAFTTFVVVLLYHTYQQVWPKLKQKLHHNKLRERVSDSSSEEGVTVDDEGRPLLAPTMSVIKFPNPRLPNITFTELDLIDTNDPQA